MHSYKCLSCDTRIKYNKLCKDHINPKWKHEKCDRPTTYRKLKVGNCTLKNCTIHIKQFLIKKKFH